MECFVRIPFFLLNKEHADRQLLFALAAIVKPTVIGLGRYIPRIQQIAEQMVEGAMRKFYEERALLEQPFIKDESKKVKDLLGAKASIVAFYRWQVGEAR